MQRKFYAWTQRENALQRRVLPVKLSGLEFGISDLEYIYGFLSKFVICNNNGKIQKDSFFQLISVTIFTI
jgi:hypothetical protein